MRRRTPKSSPPESLVALAHALGFSDYPHNSTASPYLNYILNQHVARTTQDEYLLLFRRIITYFEHPAVSEDGKDGSKPEGPSIQSLLDELTSSKGEGVFEDTPAGSKVRREDVDDTVLYILGVWTMMLSSFVRLPNGIRKIAVAYMYRTQKREADAATCSAYDESLAGLLHGKIKATRLNAFTLNVLGAVEISWTFNLSRHMLLSKHRGRYVLEMFALPCVFAGTTLTSSAVGISAELTQEIQESYRILFNAWPANPLHVQLGRFLGIRKVCWCWSCSAYRYRGRTILKLKKTLADTAQQAKNGRQVAARDQFDPMLIVLMSGSAISNWTYDLFPCLWSRITTLDEHLQVAKPWSIWILFRDRRDTLQFWTFLFATVVVMLTFFQVALGIAQAIGSFR
ncbi:hypothetical protein BCR34DRAFT_626161 [Clohesyomyces aquaticus]|uniref:Uncharacterized protein n=1 Tax=Clohesyomyces aquaticus TaxID=1231657 RepID=A0A1Y1ZE85_9PLEO|nr:hypothetical protein BCR34DRAFT_626161 [Clohesyomyces aquaticus]